MRIKSLGLLLCAMLCVSCSPVPQNLASANALTKETPRESALVQSIPIYPVNKLGELHGQVIQLTVPVATVGHTLTLIEYKSPENPSYTTLSKDIFPTDIYISVLPNTELPKVFLSRSPQSGCPVEWRRDATIFKAYCDGSEFNIDGSYISGPAPRNLDEFPVSIQQGMIWITNTVTLGSPAVATPN